MKTLFNTLILLLLAVKTEIDKNETNAKLLKLASSQEKLASSQKFHTKQILSKLDGNDENHEFHHDENSELHKIKKSKAKTNKFELNNSNVKLLLLFASVIGILALFRNGAKINNINKNVGNLSKNVGNLSKNVGNLSENIGNPENNVTSDDNSKTTVSDLISGLKTKVENLQNMMATSLTKVESLETSVTDIKTATESRNAVASKLDQITQALSQLETKVTQNATATGGTNSNSINQTVQIANDANALMKEYSQQLKSIYDIVTLIAANTANEGLHKKIDEMKRRLKYIQTKVDSTPPSAESVGSTNEEPPNPLKEHIKNNAKTGFQVLSEAYKKIFGKSEMAVEEGCKPDNSSTGRRDDEHDPDRDKAGPSKKYKNVGTSTKEINKNNDSSGSNNSTNVESHSIEVNQAQLNLLFKDLIKIHNSVNITVSVKQPSIETIMVAPIQVKNLEIPIYQLETLNISPAEKIKNSWDSNHPGDDLPGSPRISAHYNNNELNLNNPLANQENNFYESFRPDNGYHLNHLIYNNNYFHNLENITNKSYTIPNVKNISYTSKNLIMSNKLNSHLKYPITIKKSETIFIFNGYTLIDELLYSLILDTTNVYLVTSYLPIKLLLNSFDFILSYTIFRSIFSVVQPIFSYIPKELLNILTFSLTLYVIFNTLIYFNSINILKLMSIYLVEHTLKHNDIPKLEGTYYYEGHKDTSLEDLTSLSMLI